MPGASGGAAAAATQAVTTLRRRILSGNAPQHVAIGTQHSSTPQNDPFRRTTMMATRMTTKTSRRRIPIAAPAETDCGAEFAVVEALEDTGADPAAVIGGRGAAGAAGLEEAKATEADGTSERR